MRKFEFRLQRVLDYRRLQEEWAREAYRAAHAARVDAELAMRMLITERDSMLARQPKTMPGIKDLDAYVSRLEDEIESQKSIVAILTEDEERAHEEWFETRRKLRAMEHLRETAEQEWLAEVAKQEQRELDESAGRRKAA